MKIHQRAKHFVNGAFLLIAIIISGGFFYIGYLFNDAFYYLIGGVLALMTGIFVTKKDKYTNIHIPVFSIHFKPKQFLKRLSISRLKKFEFQQLHVKNHKQLITKHLGFVIFILIFSYIEFYLLPESPIKNGGIFHVITNIFIYFISQNKAYILALFFIVSATNIFFSLKKHPKFTHTLFFISVKTFLQAILAVPFSIILTFVVTLFFANILLLLTNIIPSQLGIQTDKNIIKKTINTTKENFNLVGINSNPSKTYIINSEILGLKSDFFRKTLIPMLTDRLFLPSRVLSKSIFLDRHTLFIRELDKEMIQVIAPTLAKKLIKENLSPRFIKDEPNIQIISRQDYLKYREDQINKQIEEISGYIKELNKSLGTIIYNIGVAKNNISTLQNNIQLNTQYRDEEYNNCMNDTYTIYGIYSNYTYRRYSDAYCQALRDRREQQNFAYQTELTSQQGNLSYYQGQYTEMKQYVDQFQDYKQFIEATKQLTPYELGLFEPASEVKVVLDSISDKDISTFMVTLIHEYIHYTSYISDERVLPQFFEEGLTEHFARKVMSTQLHRDTNLGYPLISKIILAMTKKIPVSKFEEIYFTKNIDELQNLLDTTYGKNFYDDSKLYFALIPLSPLDEALKFANNIMFKIGEPKLLPADAVSTY